MHTHRHACPSVITAHAPPRTSFFYAAAALGRDRRGGSTVNLTPADRPQDVYSAVADVLRNRVREHAATGNDVAQALLPEVDRKLVKQTVMTTVYGVTFIGARDQMSSRLNEVGEAAQDIFSG